LDWSPLTALTGTLRIHRVAASDIDVVAAPGEAKQKEPLTLPDLVFPLAIEIEEALVERLKVSEPGTEAPSFVLDRAALAARLQGSELDLKRLEIDLPRPRLAARATGQAKLVGGYPLGLDLSWELGLEPAVSLKGKGHIGGDLERLALDHQIGGSARARLDAHVQNLLQRPSWDGEVRLEGVDLPDFAAESPKVDLSVRVETKGDLDEATAVVTLEGKVADLPDSGHLLAKLDAHWKDGLLTLRTLDLKELVSGALFTASGDLDLNPQPGRFAITGSWESVRWPLSGDNLVESPKGRLDASGTFESFVYTLSGLAQGPDLPKADLSLAGTADQNGTRLETLEAKTLGGAVTATGDLAWAPKLHWDLQVGGQDLNPEELTPGRPDRIGLALVSKGGLDGFDYDLSVTTEGPGLPPSRLELAGTGDVKGTQVGTLRLDALDGYIEGSGRAGWAPKVTWEAELRASDINPGAFAAQWPGRIGGRVASEGALEPDGPHLSAIIDGFEGVLRGYPVAVGGQVRMAGRSIRVEGFNASSGPSVARVEGSIEDASLDLTFDLASPDLASLVPEAKGRFEAKGRVGGTIQAPQVNLELSAKDAQMAGQGIGTLTGTADLALTPDGRFDIRLDGKNLVAGGMVFDTLTVRGDGGMPSHRLSASVSGRQLSVQVEASGSLGPDRAYQGSLARLELDHDPFGAWRLQKSMPISLAGDRIAAGPLCIRNANGSGGCLGFDQTAAGQWSADIDLDTLGFELVQGFLPDNLVAEGAARVKGRFQAEAAVLTGSAVAEVPKGRILLALGEGRREELDFSSARLTVAAGAGGIDAKLGLPVSGLGDVQGNLSLPGWRLADPARPGQPLRGGVQASIDGLARLSDLLPQVSGLTGSIDSNLNLDGTLAAPRIRGQGNARGLGGE
ncbi:MAG: translocation/assembly module TamB, partial [Chromatiaceae bacterium]